jgi:hypothetical protein
MKILGIFFILVALMFTVACGNNPIRPPGEVPPIPTGVPPAVENPSVDEAKKRVAALQKELESAKQDLADAEERQVQGRVFWVAGILAFLALASGVAAWFVPVFKARFAAAAVGLGAMAALCFWLGRNVWMLPWLGAAVFVAAVIYGIYELHRGHNAARMASEFGDAAEDLLTSFGVKKDDQRLVGLKMQEMKKQTAAGVHKLIDRLRA